MDERARRVGRNEALFRGINEEIEGMERGWSAIAGEDLHVVCECGDLLCSERIPIAIAAYEHVRSDPALFVVVPGHEKPDVEHVVATESAYLVIRKDAGGPAELAGALDPRS